MYDYVLFLVLSLKHVETEAETVWEASTFREVRNSFPIHTQSLKLYFIICLFLEQFFFLNSHTEDLNEERWIG